MLRSPPSRLTERSRSEFAAAEPGSLPFSLLGLFISLVPGFVRGVLQERGHARCRRVPRAGDWDPYLARCCPGSATARPYWPAEPVPAAPALIASALSRTAMALFLAGTIAGKPA
jgi:hypothetical protein